MAKHTQTIRQQFADELFECVWPFCGIKILKYVNYYIAFKYTSKSNENIYINQSHPNLKEVVSPQPKQWIHAYSKKSKQNGRTATNEQINEHQNE